MAGAAMRWVCVFAAVAAAVAPGCSRAEEPPDRSRPVQAKKYMVKSGVVDFLLEAFREDDPVVRENRRLYFDDFGHRECEERLDPDGTVRERFFSDGTALYLLDLKERRARRIGDALAGVAGPFSAAGPATAPAAAVRRLPDRLVAGVTCNAYQLTGPVSETVHAGRDGLLLYSEVTRGSNRAVLRALAVRTGIPVGAHLFRVPDGFTLSVP